MLRPLTLALAAVVIIAPAFAENGKQDTEPGIYWPYEGAAYQEGPAPRVGDSLLTCNEYFESQHYKSELVRLPGDYLIASWHKKHSTIRYLFHVTAFGKDMSDMALMFISEDKDSVEIQTEKVQEILLATCTQAAIEGD